MKKKQTNDFFLVGSYPVIYSALTIRKKEKTKSVNSKKFFSKKFYKATILPFDFTNNE